ncbi:hypothetical protein BH23PAT2_BH23PAT2_00830 [soil metagenome]
MKKLNNNYAFIDSQNLNLGVRSLGWRLDYKKLRLYLKNKYDIEIAYMFIGMVANNQKLYTQLQQAGFVLIFKPTVRYFVNGKETIKGNVDAELVLQASAIDFPNYNKAIIVSGDGDFMCLVQFLADRQKLLHVMTPNAKYSQLLKPFSSYVVRIDQLRGSLEYKKDRHRRSVETLGLSGHGDTKNIAKKSNRVNIKQKVPPKSNKGKE